MPWPHWIVYVVLLAAVATSGLVLPVLVLLHKGVDWSGKYRLSSSDRGIFILQLCHRDHGGRVTCRRLEVVPGVTAEQEVDEILDAGLRLDRSETPPQETTYVVDRVGVPIRAVRVALNVHEQGYNGTGPPMADFPRAFVLGVDWARLVCQYLLFAILFAVGPVVIRYGRSKWRKLRPLVADDQEEEALG